MPTPTAANAESGEGPATQGQGPSGAGPATQGPGPSGAGSLVAVEIFTGPHSRNADLRPTERLLRQDFSAPGGNAAAATTALASPFLRAPRQTPAGSAGPQVAGLGRGRCQQEVPAAGCADGSGLEDGGEAAAGARPPVSLFASSAAGPPAGEQRLPAGPAGAWRGAPEGGGRRAAERRREGAPGGAAAPQRGDLAGGERFRPELDDSEAESGGAYAPPEEEEGPQGGAATAAAVSPVCRSGPRESGSAAAEAEEEELGGGAGAPIAAEAEVAPLPPNPAPCLGQPARDGAALGEAGREPGGGVRAGEPHGGEAATTPPESAPGLGIRASGDAATEPREEEPDGGGGAAARETAGQDPGSRTVARRPGAAEGSGLTDDTAPPPWKVPRLGPFAGGDASVAPGAAPLPRPRPISAPRPRPICAVCRARRAEVYCPGCGDPVCFSLECWRGQGPVLAHRCARCYRPPAAAAGAARMDAAPEAGLSPPEEGVGTRPGPSAATGAIVVAGAAVAAAAAASSSSGGSPGGNSEPPGPASRPAESGAPGLHSSHSLGHHRGLYWCWRCGSMSGAAKARLLAEPCTPKDTAAVRFQLRQLASHMPPRSPWTWPLPEGTAAGAGIRLEPPPPGLLAGRKRARQRDTDGAEGAPPAKRRPASTAAPPDGPP